ncbi:sulfatase family protein [Aspergillus ibericus CBS 121593]|uniref:Arylsulfatase n=1 Tax=Aspergillus ibericus CBS 121593 TaxID=1448316 RepID=A0A395HBG5_9EURO|nr:putative arylsulfatase [Aspergillus ibericus CBS 121593]RAL04843.1 putative arylsulfatase [Aspergillus ibericus CBS 121593]
MRFLAFLAIAGLGQAIADTNDTSSFTDHNDADQQIILDGDHSVSKDRPNIIFILVDDQDLQMDSLNYTPRTMHHIADQGATYRNHFVTTALCCPSRVSLWTGKQAHNTNVTEIYPPYGGYPKFVAEGHNDNWLPLWLQDGGYDTYYTGKLFNAHTVDNYHSPFATGFNASDFVLDPYTYQYLRPVYQRNHDSPRSYEGQHTVDVLAEKTLGFLDDALASDTDRPFFLAVAPVAPHSNLEMGDENDTTTFRFSAPIPATRHQHLFPDAIVPRTPHFNPDHPSGVSWIRTLPRQNESSIAYNDEFYRNRLRALQAVDELVEDIVQRLEDADALQNTYLFYTSDNGYHIGQHRLHPGKECGFEEDICVPMFVRGPGISPGMEVTSVTTHIDLAPTIFRIAGLPLKEEFDGLAIPLTETDIQQDELSRHEHVNVEYWGKAGFEGVFGQAPDGGPTTFYNNTYKALRLISPDFNLYYSVWCSHEHQLYDLTRDPYQLHNLYPAPNTIPTTDLNATSYIGPYPISHIISRLDALLLVLKSCQGSTCIYPWKELHPAGDVHSLRDALEGRFDHFYADQVKVQFGWCELGYLLEAEGVQYPLVYGGGNGDGLGWSEWV